MPPGQEEMSLVWWASLVNVIMSESAALGPPGPSASVVEQLACTPTLARPPSSAAGDPPPAMAGVAAPAHALVTIIPAAEVPAEYKATAAAWPIWDSKTHPQKPKGSGKFPFDYNGDYATERVGAYHSNHI